MKARIEEILKILGYQKMCRYVWSGEEVDFIETPKGMVKIEYGWSMEGPKFLSMKQFESEIRAEYKANREVTG